MTTQIKKEIQKIADQIVKNYHPEKIILFGSYAWGKPTKSSDVDFFVVKNSYKEKRFRTTEVDRIINSTIDIEERMPVDVIVYTPEELSQRLRLGDFFINRIVKEGKNLYEKK